MSTTKTNGILTKHISTNERPELNKKRPQHSNLMGCINAELDRKDIYKSRTTLYQKGVISKVEQSFIRKQ